MLRPSVIETIRRARENRKVGRCSPIFSDMDEMFEWMNNDHAKYENGECVCEQRHE